VAAGEQDAIDSFWRSLWFFSIYRLLIAMLFLRRADFRRHDQSRHAGSALFGRVAAVYVLLAARFFW
jgi:membrane protein implicated in regulation of membrane protease activity